jgi:HAD superfamily hydrolase (TIGR01509 family)
MTPRAIVFDNDGLLVDTEPCWTRAQETIFARHGSVFDLSAKQALVGTSPQTAAAVLERLLNAPGRGKELSSQLYDLAFDEITEGAKPRPGAVELVTELRTRRPIAVASNVPRRHLVAALTRAGLADLFETTVSVDDVERPKPAPDLYLRACDLLGVSPNSAVGVEDSPPGVAAARAAGLYVIGIPSVPGIALEADLVASSLSENAVRRAVGLI